MAKPTSSKSTRTNPVASKSPPNKAPIKKQLISKSSSTKVKSLSKDKPKTKSAVKTPIKAQKAQNASKGLAAKTPKTPSRKPLGEFISSSAKPSAQPQLGKASQPAFQRKAQCQKVTIVACNRFMQNLKSMIEAYTRLIESIAPGARLPQQSAWYLRQGQLEMLEPVLASLEAAIQSPKIKNDDINAWQQTLPNLGRMIGAAPQVIPHVYQTQALHILLHLGEHPELPDELVAPLAEALYSIARQPKHDHLEQRHMNRAQRILKGLTPMPFADIQTSKASSPNRESDLVAHYCS